MEANQRFWLNVRKTNKCWDWLASRYANGYGKFYVGGRAIKAHRFAYELLVGTIPEGLEIDHLCRNRACVNPNHMELVTRGENIRRGLLPEIGRQYQQGKTHCPQGHTYNEQNTYRRLDRPGRECKACRAMAQKKWRLRNARS